MTPSLRRGLRHLVEPAPGTSRRIPLGLAAGLRFAAEPAATASADFWIGVFESEIAPAIRRLARPGVACVDVGTNSGYYALTLAARCHAPVIGFEPDPAARERLARNLALNPELAPLITVRAEPVGAATADGVIALDDVLGERDAIGLLKIDVDGPEVQVLAGARTLLATGRPHVVVETHSAQLEHECAALLLSAGYRPRVVTQRRLLPQDRPRAHNRWLIAEGRTA